MTGEFESVHVFYNTPDLRPVVVNCVDPLVSELASADLIKRFFFIRYWEGGSHIRLRLELRSGGQRERVHDIVAARIGAFLESQPSMFDLDPVFTGPTMRVLYEFEFGKEAYVRKFGADGHIPMQENNSFRYIAYEPEYGRYGGPRGIEIAHDHFHVSSKLALDILRDETARHKNRILGLAFQLMLHFAWSFLEDRKKTAEFYRHYGSVFGDLRLPERMTSELDRFFGHQAPMIFRYVNGIEQLHGKLRDTDRGVIGRHILEAYRLRDVVAAAGRLDFDPPRTSSEDARKHLLTSYVHMTNNRLGVRTFEEFYIANMIVRSLGEAV